MAAFVNLSFEDAGPSPGLAAGWDYDSVATVELIAAYGPRPFTKPDETFEDGWNNESFVFTLDPINPTQFAFYDPGGGLEDREDFEEQWSANEFFSVTIGSIDPAEYDVGVPQEFEDFEEEWSNTPFKLAFVGGDLSDASYDTATPETVEDFGEEWSFNEFFQTTFSMFGPAPVTIFAAGDIIRRDDAVSWLTTDFIHLENGDGAVEIINSVSNDGVHPITGISSSNPEDMVSSDALVNDASSVIEIWDHERAAYAGGSGRFENFETTWSTMATF